MITVCIPTYKRPHLLKKTLTSVQNQTFKDLKIIVADDCSSDETASIVEELALHDTRIHYICHPQNIGMFPNYAFLFSQVSSDLFAFVSDDDVWFPDFCQNAFDGLSRIPEALFFACSTICFSPQKGVLRVSLASWPREGLFCPPEGMCELIGKYPFPAHILFRRETLNHAHMDTQNPYAWDSDFLIQMASRFPYGISKRPGGLFLHHSGSLTSTQSTEVVVNAMHRLRERILDLPDLDQTIKERAAGLVSIDLHRAHRASIVASILQKNFKKAKEDAYSLIKNTKKNSANVSLLMLAIGCSIFPPFRLLLIFLKKSLTFYRRTLKWIPFKKFYNLPLRSE